MSEVFSGQGQLYVGDREPSTGVLGVLRPVGSASAFALAFETDVLQHKESITGRRSVDNRLIRELNGSVTLTLDEWLAKNLALALFGTDSTITGTTVTDEPLAGGATDVADGDFVSTLQAGISALTITDSNGTPVTLVEDTDYRIKSAAHGTIEFLTVAAYTQPFLASYTYTDALNVNMLTIGLEEKWLRLDGINTARNDAPVRVDLYRVALDPTEDMALIGDEYGLLTLNGSMLTDDTKANDPVLGQVGRIVRPTLT